MKSKVVVIHEGNQFLLMTSFGFKIGSRMLTAAPEAGKDFPELTDRFETKAEADRAAMKWNLYLLHADKKRSKTKQRISE
jgi:hypothetical protein